ncbi:SDR family NAD(P)-dependent oxidoreductase [Shimia abyssi]|uniref:NAD(P)-dependent dehydrogenase (Short-subunit alcohol dehydrogenase family) n=1 Tax=Shimia abyssi TaxID=1662395 RepID=A0A2P8F5Z6_9RHOB|nr:SDR family NAD(P)-dependent oxidoreductase [Shimia abyssi]PSL17129.1 NAD(P)-dependent dehydrogenase (short-subunit alcohol dehydrogenase family) [Shimia abyssi]
MHALITGANRGIGQALDQTLRAKGYDVTGTSRAGGEFEQLDVTDFASQSQLAQRLDSRPIDLLVCNAGVYLDRGQNLADGYPADMWAASFAANVTGVFLTVQALLPNLQLGHVPRIAIISSQMASQERAPGGSYIYRSSKAAALNLGRNLAADLHHIGIAVGIYHPGWVRTDMGGEQADISVKEAANGLSERFEILSLDTTGCFETWDGRPHAY